MITACRPISYDDGLVRLTSLTPDVDLSSLDPDNAARPVLEVAIQDCFDRQARLASLPSSGGGHMMVSSDSSSRNQAYNAAQQHPLVQQILKRLDADIIAREPSPRERWQEQHESKS